MRRTDRSHGAREGRAEYDQDKVLAQEPSKCRLAADHVDDLVHNARDAIYTYEDDTRISCCKEAAIDSRAKTLSVVSDWIQ